MPPQQKIGIWLPRKLIEIGVIDVVTTVRGKGHTVTSLIRRGPRLGVLSRETANPGHGTRSTMHEHETHLQKDLQLGSDVIGRALIESLGTVSTLKEKAFAAGGFRQLTAKRLDLPGSHQRRDPPQTLVDHGSMIAVPVGGLLKGAAATPRIRCPVFRVTMI